LRDAIDNLFGYDWLILKNARAAEYFLRRFLETHRPDQLDQLRVLTIGSEAAERVAEFQIHVDIALDRFAREHSCREVESYVARGNLARLNVLVPSANVTREAFEEEFADAGARVDSIAVYRTTSGSDQLPRLKALLAGAAIDFIRFASASEIGECAALFDTDDLGRLLSGVTVVCLDEATVKTANEFGLSQTSTPSASGLEPDSEFRR